MANDPPYMTDPSHNDRSTAYSQALRHKMADEMDLLREDMENLGVQLCLDEEVMLRCMPYLQRLDEMGQRSMWIAALLRSDDPVALIPEITLQVLADRMASVRQEILAQVAASDAGQHQP